MRVISKPLSRNGSSIGVSNLFETRMGGAVVQAASPKLSLGSTGNPYLSSVAETTSLTAVIASLGQAPSQIPGIRPSDPQASSLEAQFFTQPAVSNFPTSIKETLLSSTPVELIVNLSQPQTENVSSESGSHQQLASLHTTPINHTLEIHSLPTQVASIEVLSLSNAAISNLPKLPSVTQSNLSLSSLPIVANDAINLSGIVSLISNTPLPTLASLGVQNSPEPTSNNRSDQPFDGITVSGQGESLDVLLLVGGLRSLPISSQAANQKMSEPYADANASLVAQHSLVVIVLTSQSTSELFPN